MTPEQMQHQLDHQRATGGQQPVPQVDQWGRPLAPAPQVDQWSRPLTPAPQPNQPQVDQWGRPLAPAPQPNQPQVDQWGRPLAPAPQPNQPQVDQWGRPLRPAPRVNQPQVDQWGRPLQPVRDVSTPPITFGTDNPFVQAPLASVDFARRRKSRVSTVTPKTPLQHPPLDVEALEQPVVATPAVRVIPIVEPGIQSRLVSEDVNATEYEFKGVSIMPELPTVNTTVKSFEDECMSPVPDTNILGDEIYAGLQNNLNVNDYSVVCQAIVAEYCFHELATSKLKIATEFVDINTYIRNLKLDIKEGHHIAAHVNKKLTMYMNALLSDTGYQVDDLAADYGELANLVSSEFSGTNAEIYTRGVAQITAVAKKINIVAATPETGSISRAQIPETYVVIPEDVITTDMLVSDKTIFLSKESSPTGYEAIMSCISDANDSTVYLLTDTTKYLVVSTRSRIYIVAV